MNFNYRQVIHGIELTEKEAKTLYDAEDILATAHNKLNNVNGTEIDEDLMPAIDKAMYSLAECNARLNVRTTLGVD